MTLRKSLSTEGIRRHESNANGPVGGTKCVDDAECPAGDACDVGAAGDAGLPSKLIDLSSVQSDLKIGVAPDWPLTAAGL